MRRVVLYELVSIDGVAEEPGDWMGPVDAAVVDNLARVIARQDDVLLGRATYDYWAGYWPTSDHQPFADFINGTPKHVFSSGTPVGGWPNTTVVTAPAVDHVRAMRETGGGDIGIHGSATLARSLLRAGLVDEMRLVVAPAVAGRGRRLFADEGDLQRFDLVQADATPSGVLLLGYARRV